MPTSTRCCGSRGSADERRIAVRDRRRALGQEPLWAGARRGGGRRHGVHRDRRGVRRRDARKDRADRNSVVEGKSVSVRVDIGDSRIFNKKNDGGGKSAQAQTNVHVITNQNNKKN